MKSSSQTLGRRKARSWRRAPVLALLGIAIALVLHNRRSHSAPVGSVGVQLSVSGRGGTMQRPAPPTEQSRDDGALEEESFGSVSVHDELAAAADAAAAAAAAAAQGGASLQENQAVGGLTAAAAVESAAAAVHATQAGTAAAGVLGMGTDAAGALLGGVQVVEAEEAAASGGLSDGAAAAAGGPGSWEGAHDAVGAAAGDGASGTVAGSTAGAAGSVADPGGDLPADAGGGGAAPSVNPRAGSAVDAQQHQQQQQQQQVAQAEHPQLPEQSDHHQQQQQQAAQQQAEQTEQQQGVQADPVAGIPITERETALRGCKTLSCVRQAHMQPKHPQQFNFPHFYILGFPKCATTSLYRHLIQHPSIMAPLEKEPDFFTARCGGDALACSPEEQERYITQTMHLDVALQARIFMATFEGTVHYSWAGAWLAPQLRQLMPWIKLVLSVREPISQAVSMLKHNLDHGRAPSCYDAESSIFKCIARKLEAGDTRYSTHLRAWVGSFPREQLFVMQYENLTDPGGMKRVLRDVKRFVGIEPKLPSDDLGLHNSRNTGDGWPMPRSELQRLTALARREADSVIELVRRYGFADADGWRANWELAWQRNLDSCEPGDRGSCMVYLT